jgi:hypothetical protein
MNPSTNGVRPAIEISETPVSSTSLLAAEVRTRYVASAAEASVIRTGRVSLRPWTSQLPSSRRVATTAV